jgi:hypothetical protein
MSTPDSPDEKSLRRVLLIAAIDGWSVALFAGLCTVISLLLGEWIGVLIGGIITTCGVVELRGRRHLAAGQIDGMKWLVRAQVIILATILIYALENMAAYDEAAMLAQLTPEMRSYLSQSGISVDDLRPMIKPVFFGFYLLVTGVTVLFQGGLALYYNTRKPKVAAALAARHASR